MFPNESTDDLSIVSTKITYLQSEIFLIVSTQYSIGSVLHTTLISCIHSEILSTIFWFSSVIPIELTAMTSVIPFCLHASSISLPVYSYCPNVLLILSLLLYLSLSSEVTTYFTKPSLNMFLISSLFLSLLPET